MTSRLTLRLGIVLRMVTSLTVRSLFKYNAQIDGNELFREGKYSCKGKHDDPHPARAEHRGGDCKR